MHITGLSWYYGRETGCTAVKIHAGEFGNPGIFLYNRDMKYILYYIALPFIMLFGLPVMLTDKNAWNRFGRKVDRFFGVESRHTRNYNAQ